MFLTLFAFFESGLRIDDPVRDLLQRTVLVEPNDCVSSRVFAIQHEQVVGNAHSVRAAFERALHGDACRGSVDLWIAYIRFCHDQPALRSKAKDIFYRAVHACPWSKEVAMEAFQTLSADMEASELRAVFNTMQAKGLRIRLELDEFVKQWR